MRYDKILLLTALVFYVGYDLVSTLIAFQYLGSFEYEKSAAMKFFYGLGGVYGFILAKTLFGSLAILAAYVLSWNVFGRYSIGMFGHGILLGASLAGAYVGTSNLWILVSGHSIWLLGIDSGTIATLLILLCGFGGLFVGIREEKKTAGKIVG